MELFSIRIQRTFQLVSTVYVYGTLVHTGEKRCFYYVIYLGPISTR